MESYYHCYLIDKRQKQKIILIWNLNDQVISNVTPIRILFLKSFRSKKVLSVLLSDKNLISSNRKKFVYQVHPQEAAYILD